MFLFIYSFSMPESKTFYFSFEVAIIGTIYGLWEVAAYYTSDEPGRTFYHFDFVLFSILLGVHVLATNSRLTLSRKFPMCMKCMVNHTFLLFEY